ncbi:hypothetical protein PGT21_018135 [Puccinia graminis f. sp. tritici]|uniref:Uncharacterized protein n=1 Tax=Puccinia graminis f. sp. tritici TaxID=56615 RepID=A0A5B0Q6J4_PUCGR|nr:hypothetical protein PGT21_018135 [Puccinia graminis f. sp. tritici]
MKPLESLHLSVVVTAPEIQLKIPSGIPPEYRGVGRVAVTEEGLPSLSEYLLQSLPPTSIPAQTTTPKLS